MSESGFLKYQRQPDAWKAPLDRLKSFDEFHIPADYETRMEQASRCMHCGVPFCQSAIELKGMVTGCPLHNLIPEWNEELFNGNDQYALDRLLKTNPFPEFTSRVCPALCEKACLNGVDSEPTTVHDNEFYIIENGFEKGWVTLCPPQTSTGKSVGIIGSGPAGLAAAQLLRQRGHEVHVYERDDKPGGLLQYGIPNMKLDKSVVRRRIDLMKDAGVQFHCNVEAGRDLSMEELKNRHDALIIAAGSRKPRPLAAQGMENVSGIHYALEYLSASTKSVESQKKPAINAKGKHVVVLGGGDTGNDCIGTALRQQAKSILQLEVMPEPSETRQEDNPWPEWPKIKKTDYGQQEAIVLFQKDPRLFSTTINKVHAKNGKICAVDLVEVDNHFRPVEGTERTVKCDLPLIAAGFVGIEEGLKDSFHLPVTARNVVETEPSSHKVKNSSLFVCGDAKRGPSLVVWAISQGRVCAREVDHALMGYSNIEG